MITKDNHLGIIVEKNYEDEIGGFRLDPMYDPTEHARTFGTVKYTPNKFSRGWNIDRFFFQPGDRVHFHFDAINDGSTVKYEDEDGDTVYIVNIFKIYIRERDGEFTPRSGKCVCEPYYEVEDPKLEVKDVEVDGVKIKAICSKASGITVDFNVKAHDRIATVRMVGKNMSHEPPPEFAPGDKVFRDKHTNLEYKLNGELLYIIDQELILGKYE